MVYVQPKTSKYLPIWNKLKAEKFCRITAPIIYHRTIIKMVKNKRDDDYGYKLELAEANRKHKIKIKVSGTIITFTLQERMMPNGI